MNDNNSTALFAKQPIFDQNNQLYGYEILFRDSEENIARITDASKATMQLLTNYCSSICDSDIEQHVKIFVNIPQEFILSETFFPLPPNRLVIEILEDVQVDQTFLERVKSLKQKGYTFCIDDYHPALSIDDLMPLLDIIKIDILDRDLPQLNELFQQLHAKLARQKHKPILLAEKVESEMVMKACRKAGANLFQGFYLKRPEIVFGQKITPSSQAILNLLATLQNPEATIDRVCEQISCDLRLSYQLLKIVNSPLCRLPKKVESIKDAVVYLGLDAVKKWTMIIGFLQQEDFSLELYRILMERAKMCQLIAHHYPGCQPETAFTVGLFSGIDLVLRADKSWLLSQLNLNEEIVQAIISREGPYGNLLRSAILMENGVLQKLVTILPFDFEQMIRANLEAHIWVAQIINLPRSE